MRVIPKPGEVGAKVLPPSTAVTPSGEPVNRPPGGALHTIFIVTVVSAPLVDWNSVVIVKMPGVTWPYELGVVGAKLTKPIACQVPWSMMTCGTGVVLSKRVKLPVA